MFKNLTLSSTRFLAINLQIVDYKKFMNRWVRSSQKHQVRKEQNHI